MGIFITRKTHKIAPTEDSLTLKNEEMGVVMEIQLTCNIICVRLLKCCLLVFLLVGLQSPVAHSILSLMRRMTVHKLQAKLTFYVPVKTLIVMPFVVLLLFLLCLAQGILICNNCQGKFLCSEYFTNTYLENATNLSWFQMTD